MAEKWPSGGRTIPIRWMHTSGCFGDALNMFLSLQSLAKGANKSLVFRQKRDAKSNLLKVTFFEHCHYD